MIQQGALEVLIMLQSAAPAQRIRSPAMGRVLECVCMCVRTGGETQDSMTESHSVFAGSHIAALVLERPKDFQSKGKGTGGKEIWWYGGYSPNQFSLQRAAVQYHI